MEICSPNQFNDELLSIPSQMIDVHKSRADNFPLEEIELMLKEMKCRSEIILSLSPSSHRLKKSAWEEVTAIMGIYFQKRTPEQVKKKWENLLTKTRRKVRQGLMNTSSWSHLNDMVWNFLIENRETKYLFGPGRFSRASELSNLLGVSVASESKTEHHNSMESWSICSPIEQALINENLKNLGETIETMKDDSVDSKDEQDLIDKSCKNDFESFVISDPVNSVPFSPLLSQMSKSSQEEVLTMWKSEHTMRMKVLAMQHEAAFIQLKLMKIQLEKATGIRYDNK